MKKYLYFIVTFAAIFFVLQLISGAALMAMYTPDLSLSMWEPANSSGVIQRPNMLPSFISAIIALSATFGAFKIFSKKFGEHRTIA